MRVRNLAAGFVLAVVFFGHRFAGAALPWQPAGTGDLDLVTVRTVTNRIESSHDVILSAYVLAPNGAMARALAAAAHRGAKVHVVLDGVAFGAARRMNGEVTPRLREAGVRVDFTRAPLHAKAAVVDGHVYLSDRNWTRSRAELVLEDRLAADEPVVLRAITGVAGMHGRLTTRKADSLAAEAAVLAGNRTHEVAVETEAFGLSTPVDVALLARRSRGDRVRLIVDQREYRSAPLEREQVAELVRHGVEVRIGRSGEKLAIDGDAAWIGSANATPGLPDQVDWGVTATPNIANAIKLQFETNWSNAEDAT